MFAVISSPNFFNEIEQAISSKGESILYKRIDKDIDIVAELDKISRLSIKYLIIDITCAEDQKKIPQAVRRFKIMNDKPQIIIIAPNCVPGNEIISMLVTMGVYDIINPQGLPEDIIILPSLLEHIEHPAGYKKGAKWDIGTQIDTPQSSGNTASKRNVVEKEKIVTVVENKIIGPVIIGVAGTGRGVGCTHISLAISYFLASQNKEANVAYLELNNSKDIYSLNMSCPAALKDGSFSLCDIDFYGGGTSVTDLILLNHYKYIVLDIGELKQNTTNEQDSHSAYHEFIRASVPILVCGSKPWQVKNISNCLYKDESENTGTLTWKILLNLSELSASKDLSNCMKRPVFNMPFCPELFTMDDTVFNTLSGILQEYMPHNKPVKKKRLLFF